MTTLPRAASARLPLLAAAAAALIGFAPAGLCADAPATVQVLFSDHLNDPTPVRLLLRPTVQQQLFVYVQPEGQDLKDVTVEVLADGATVAKTDKPFTAVAGQPTLADFSKPTPPAAPPAPAPAAPAAPPAAKPAAPVLEEVKGPVVIQVFDKDHKPVGAPQPVEVSPPSSYIDLVPGGAVFDPAPASGKNRLAVRLSTAAHFFGPPCRVELALVPDRIPGLRESPRKEGTRAGYIARTATQEGELTLTAQNLAFDWPTAGGGVQGLVYLTIDGWERAYTLRADFEPSGDPTTLSSVERPMIRLVAPNFANPAAPYPVKIEADRANNDLVELGVDRSGGTERPHVGGFRAENNEILRFPADPRIRPTDRRVRMLFSAAGEGGSLLLQPQVEDWKTDVDVTGIEGERDLRVRLLHETPFWGGGVTSEVSFWGARPLEFGEEAPKTPAPLGTFYEFWGGKALFYLVAFDASQPQDITLVFPKKVKRGDLLRVAATIEPADQVKEIAAVLFYVGKPGPDGKPPANAEPVTVTGPPDQDVKTDKGATVKGWAADLPLPPGAKDKDEVPVTVTFVKVNNLTRTGTVKVILEEPAPPAGAAASGPAAPKPLNVSGVVFQAGQAVIDRNGKTTLTPDARPQQGIEVHLTDDKGALKDVAKTDVDGKYVFNGVAPGAYKVTAAKTTDSTAGQSAVQVVDKDKADVDIKLTR